MWGDAGAWVISVEAYGFEAYTCCRLASGRGRGRGRDWGTSTASTGTNNSNGCSSPYSLHLEQAAAPRLLGESRRAPGS